MSDKKLRYDTRELNTTADMAKDIINLVQDSVRVLENPEDYSHEQVSWEWAFVSGLSDALIHNKKMISFGLNHELFMLPRELTKDNEEINKSISDHPIFM